MTFDELKAQVEALTQQLQTQQQQVTGRSSEIRKPLSNLLYPPPSATVAKPNFFFEGANSVERTQPGPFPAVRFKLTESGVEERAARNQSELDALEADGWQRGMPEQMPVSQTDEVEDALASLTPEERTMVIAESQVQRRAALTARLAALPAADAAAVSDASATLKRKPGRPKKA